MHTVLSYDPLAEFLARRALAAPDGRHIYAYRISAIESATFAEYLQEHLPPGETRYPLATAKIFCLWAADHWRRTYEGGTPAWNSLLRTVNADHLATGEHGYLALQRLVQDGIAGLGLQLVVIGRTREFLATLICEGGLPLNVVKRAEEHALLSFFRAVFRSCEAHRVGERLAGDITIVTLTRQAASYLPRTLRQDVVFELAAQIVTEVRRLLPAVGDAPDPIVALDRYDARWREAFPLDLPDEVSRVFLGQLVRTARSAQQQGGTPLRFVRMLVRRGGVVDGDDVSRDDQRFELDGLLELPRSVPESVVADLLKINELPNRFDLALRSGMESTTVAIGSVRKDDEGRLVRFDVLGGGQPVVSGDAAVGEQRLLLRSAQTVQPSVEPFRGSTALSELPWVFAAREEGGALELRADRSTSVRSGEAFVAVATDSTVVAEGQDSRVERCGTLVVTPTREVYSVHGHVRITDPLGNQAVVHTGSDDEDEREHVLSGRRFATSRGDVVAFQGVPTLREVRSSGLSLNVPNAEIEWRSTRPNAGWAPLRAYAMGDGLLRRVQQGSTTFSARVQLMPARFEMQARPRTAHEGTLVLRSLDGADADVVGSANWESQVRRVGADTLEIDIRFIGTSPSTVPVRLVWPERGVATVEAPAPIERVRFEDMRGGLQLHRAGVAASQLTYFRASAMMPDTRRTFWIEGTLARAQAVVKDATEGARRLQREMPSIDSGIYELEMGNLQPAIEEMLAGSDVLDDQVRLVIRAEPPLGGASVELMASRYDLALEHGQLDPLHLRGEDLIRLNPREVESLRLIAFPIARPQDEPIELAKVGSGAWCFEDEPTHAGPWLVSGWSGNWCRVRPLLVMRGRVEPKEYSTSLVDAVLQDNVRRGPDIEQRLEIMATDPDHPDWELVDGYLQWTPDFPASTFDVLRLLARNSKAVTMAAVRAAEREALKSDGSVERLRKCLRTLPFSWYALPMQAWRKSFGHWIAARERALANAGMPNVKASVMEWFVRPVATQLGDAWMPWLRPVFDHVAFEQLEADAGHALLAVMKPTARTNHAKLLFDAMKELSVEVMPSPAVPSTAAVFAALPAVRPLLDGSQLLFAQNHLYQHEKNHHLVNAPLIAATCAVRGITLTSNTQAQLRAVYGYNPGWFEKVYGAAYRFGLAATFSNFWPSPEHT